MLYMVSLSCFASRCFDISVSQKVTESESISCDLYFVDENSSKFENQFGRLLVRAKKYERLKILKEKGKVQVS